MTSGISFLEWGKAPWLMAVFLLTLRVGALLMMTPILYAISLPPTIRTLLILSVSVTLAMGMLPNGELAALRLNSGAAYIFVASLRELVLGATLALGVLVAFAAISVAGRLLDIQIGFGIAQVFDPLSRAQLPILTTAFNQLAIIFFFTINGHHTLLRAVSFSLERFPLGQAWSLDAVAGPVLKQVGILFSLGFALASPVVVCVLLVELALGVVARNLPQMNMFVMGVPVKIVVGLAALSIWFIATGGVMARVHSSIFQTWDWMFTASAQRLPVTGGGR